MLRVQGGVVESVSSRSIGAIVFDFDGVLRTWDVRQTHAIELKYGLAKGTVGALAFEPELADRAVTGVISDFAWRDEVAERAARLYGGKRSQRGRGVVGSNWRY